jgi:hypothetical protein
LVSSIQRDVESSGVVNSRASVAADEVKQESLISLAQSIESGNNVRLEVVVYNVSIGRIPVPPDGFHGAPSSLLSGARLGGRRRRGNRGRSRDGGRCVQKVAFAVAAAVIFIAALYVLAATVATNLTIPSNNRSAGSVGNAGRVNSTALHRGIAFPSIWHCFGCGAKAASNVVTTTRRSMIGNHTVLNATFAIWGFR